MPSSRQVRKTLSQIPTAWLPIMIHKISCFLNVIELATQVYDIERQKLPYLME